MHFPHVYIFQGSEERKRQQAASDEAKKALKNLLR